jgi:hypothetical protein
LLGEAESSLGDAESSLGDAESLLGDTKRRARWVAFTGQRRHGTVSHHRVRGRVRPSAALHPRGTASPPFDSEELDRFRATRLDHQRWTRRVPQTFRGELEQRSALRALLTTYPPPTCETETTHADQAHTRPCTGEAAPHGGLFRRGDADERQRRAAPHGYGDGHHGDAHAVAVRGRVPPPAGRRGRAGVYFKATLLTVCELSFGGNINPSA